MKLYKINLNFIKGISKWNFNNNKNQRQPIINEALSEGIIQLFICEHEGRKCINSFKKCGDLLCNKSIIEVKCFSTNAPISFGSSKWNELYILDATNFKNNIFEIYKCKLSNLSRTFQNIKLYGNKKYSDFYKSGKRCKITFGNLKNQLKYNLKLVFSGSIQQLEK